MSPDLTARKDAIKARLDLEPGYGPSGPFLVERARATKTRPATIKVSWVGYPHEEKVLSVLGDLYDPALVTLNRIRLWTCGFIHDSNMDAWLDHEGAAHEDDCYYRHGERVLTQHVEQELREAGETFETACRPGNYVPCPTCGGGALLYTTGRTLEADPCPDCARLGTNHSPLTPGILDLDRPDHLAFYEEVRERVRSEEAARAAKAERKRAAALTNPATTVAPQWMPLPTRDAGLINGLPVAQRVGCDYLTHAHDPDRAVCCSNLARWFDPTTGLRVCTRHKTTTQTTTQTTAP